VKTGENEETKKNCHETDLPTAGEQKKKKKNE